MARRFVRDAKGRFAGKGFSGQTGGRGARLKSGKGNTRDTGGARATVGTGKPKGTVSGTKVGRSSDSAERMIKRDIAAKRAARQSGDTASVNVPMKGRRGKQLDASISRNVRQQKATARAESKDRNRQFKADQSKAKQLRAKYESNLATSFSAKSGKSVTEIKSAIRGMAPSKQIKVLTMAGREQRAQANKARTADTRNIPGSKMIRRPSSKTMRSNFVASRAIDYYANPTKALREVKSNKPGFRMPRGFRK